MEFVKFKVQNHLMKTKTFYRKYSMVSISIMIIICFVHNTEGT